MEHLKDSKVRFQRFSEYVDKIITARPDNSLPLKIADGLH